MNIQIRYKHAKISGALKNYLQEKLDRFEKLIPKNTMIEIELRGEPRQKKGRNKVLNYTVNIPGEKTIHIAKASYDFRSVIDIASDKLEKKLTRYHNKKAKRTKQDSIVKRTLKAAGYIPQIPKILFKRPKKEPKIVYKNEYSGKAIYPETAIEKFNNSKEQFIIFRNIENNKVCIVTKEKRKTVIYTIVSWAFSVIFSL